MFYAVNYIQTTDIMNTIDSNNQVTLAKSNHLTTVTNQQSSDQKHREIHDRYTDSCSAVDIGIVI